MAAGRLNLSARPVLRLTGPDDEVAADVRFTPAEVDVDDDGVLACGTVGRLFNKDVAADCATSFLVGFDGSLGISSSNVSSWPPPSSSSSESDMKVARSSCSATADGGSGDRAAERYCG